MRGDDCSQSDQELIKIDAHKQDAPFSYKSNYEGDKFIIIEK